MKQYITKEQLDELTQEEQDIFWGELSECVREFNRIKGEDLLPSIGQMIEFLGENISIDDDLGQWFVRINCEFINGEVCNSDAFLENEFCDALWKACKFKLNKLTPA